MDDKNIGRNLHSKSSLMKTRAQANKTQESNEKGPMSDPLPINKTKNQITEKCICKKKDAAKKQEKKSLKPNNVEKNPPSANSKLKCQLNTCKNRSLEKNQLKVEYSTCLCSAIKLNVEKMSPSEPKDKYKCKSKKCVTKMNPLHTKTDELSLSTGSDHSKRNREGIKCKCSKNKNKPLKREIIQPDNVKKKGAYPRPTKMDTRLSNNDKLANNFHIHSRSSELLTNKKAPQLGNDKYVCKSKRCRSRSEKSDKIDRVTQKREGSTQIRKSKKSETKFIELESDMYPGTELPPHEIKSFKELDALQDLKKSKEFKTLNNSFTCPQICPKSVITNTCKSKISLNKECKSNICNPHECKSKICNKQVSVLFDKQLETETLITQEETPEKISKAISTDIGKGELVPTKLKADKEVEVKSISSKVLIEEKIIEPDLSEYDGEKILKSITPTKSKSVSSKLSIAETEEMPKEITKKISKETVKEVPKIVSPEEEKVPKSISPKVSKLEMKPDEKPKEDVKLKPDTELITTDKPKAEVLKPAVIKKEEEIVPQKEPTKEEPVTAKIEKDTTEIKKIEKVSKEDAKDMESKKPQEKLDQKLESKLQEPTALPEKVKPEQIEKLKIEPIAKKEPETKVDEFKTQDKPEEQQKLPVKLEPKPKDTPEVKLDTTPEIKPTEKEILKDIPQDIMAKDKAEPQQEKKEILTPKPDTEQTDKMKIQPDEKPEVQVDTKAKDKPEIEQEEQKPDIKSETKLMEETKKSKETVVEKLTDTESKEKPQSLTEQMQTEPEAKSKPPSEVKIPLETISKAKEKLKTEQKTTQEPEIDTEEHDITAETDLKDIPKDQQEDKEEPGDGVKELKKKVCICKKPQIEKKCTCTQVRSRIKTSCTCISEPNKCVCSKNKEQRTSIKSLPKIDCTCKEVNRMKSEICSSTSSGFVFSEEPIKRFTLLFKEICKLKSQNTSLSGNYETTKCFCQEPLPSEPKEKDDRNFAQILLELLNEMIYQKKKSKICNCLQKIEQGRISSSKQHKKVCNCILKKHKKYAPKICFCVKKGKIDSRTYKRVCSPTCPSRLRRGKKKLTCSCYRREKLSTRKLRLSDSGIGKKYCIDTCSSKKCTCVDILKKEKYQKQNNVTKCISLVETTKPLCTCSQTR